MRQAVYTPASAGMTVFELIDALRNFELDDQILIGSEYNALPVKEISQYSVGSIHIEPDTAVKNSDLHFGNDLPQPDRQIIDRADLHSMKEVIDAAERGLAEVGIGEKINFNELLYGKREN